MKNIGLITPSSPCYELKNIDIVRQWFKGNGYNVVLSDNFNAKNRFLAGTDNERADDIHRFFANKNIDIIVCFRGGYGSERILDLLDYDLISQNKKPFLGFSDSTALQLALYKKSNLISFSGLCPATDIDDNGKMDLLLSSSFHLWQEKKSMDIELKYFQQKPPPSDISGTLIGGTLSILEQLIGTPYLPDMQNTILFIEDVHEDVYKIDRMLTHLRLSGILDKVSGLVFGNFKNCYAEDKNDGTLSEVIFDLSKRMPNLHIWTGLPYGHTKSRIILPIGSTASITGCSLFFDFNCK